MTVIRKRIEKEEKEKDSRCEEDKAKHKWIGLLRCINYAPPYQLENWCMQWERKKREKTASSYEYESDGVKTEGKRIERGREPVADFDNLGAPIIIKHEERDIGEKRKKF